MGFYPLQLPHLLFNPMLTRNMKVKELNPKSAIGIISNA